MNDIKVTVEYEIPKLSAFDEMMVQYAAVKKCAEQTIAYFAPLADAAEEAKAAAIIAQIEVIADYVRKLQSLGGIWRHSYAVACGGVRDDGYCFTVKATHDGFEAKWRSALFTLDNVKRHPAAFNAEENDCYNIIGNWDKWRMFEKLERHCLRQLQEAIDEQKKAAEHERKRLDNIVR